jgi:hypothetical protein
MGDIQPEQIGAVLAQIVGIIASMLVANQPTPLQPRLRRAQRFTP